VAIVQVSRITNRKGLAENLPQLAGAELGWAIDERRLFIGNGTLQEGAPTIGNTEILTEFSDILAQQSNYTYKGLAAGYQVVTGPNNSDVVLSLQAWLDQFASVRDFGAVGDGVTDDTAAINRALFQLYCREINPQIRRALFFPAGVYRITGTILVPSYARLYGEGANSSLIVMDADASASYVIQYADSLQQTGVNIGNNGATPPTNIEISTMGFQTLSANADVALVENAGFCTFTDVSFRGPFDITDFVPSPGSVIAADIAAVRFASSASLTVSNITFRRCEFSALTFAFHSSTNTKGVVVSESTFDLLYRGVVLANPGSVNPGSAGFRILGNSFDRIHQQGIQTQANQQLVVSGYNIFYNVGNGLSSPITPATPVIEFLDSNNVSVGDLFQRTDTQAQTRPRIQIGNNTNIAITNGKQIQLGTYTRESGVNAALITGSTSQALFTVDSDRVPAFKLDYTIVRSGDDSSGSEVRTGTITVVRSTDGTGGDLVANDAFFENGDTGFALAVSESSGIITVAYTDDFPAGSRSDGNIKYSLSYLA
jgi:hypothetical protein